MLALYSLQWLSYQQRWETSVWRRGLSIIDQSIAGSLRKSTAGLTRSTSPAVPVWHIGYSGMWRFAPWFCSPRVLFQSVATECYKHLRWIRFPFPMNGLILDACTDNLIIDGYLIRCLSSLSSCVLPSRCKNVHQFDLISIIILICYRYITLK